MTAKTLLIMSTMVALAGNNLFILKARQNRAFLLYVPLPFIPCFTALISHHKR